LTITFFQKVTAEQSCWNVKKRDLINPLTSNEHYSGRTAPLTSKLSISYIYSTNIGTEYFKNGIYSPFFPFKNAVFLYF